MAGLTDKQVKNAKPGRHADGRGLYLLVKPSGARSWLLRIQYGGRRRDFGLGAYPDVGLAEAREKALEGRKLVKAGKDPSIEWKRTANAIPTFKEVAGRYHASITPGLKSEKHAAQWYATLKAYAFPAIGSLTVDQIQASDIARALEPIWLRIPETARRTRQRITAVLDYSHAQGWRDTEAPVRAVGKLLGGIRQPKPGNFAAMPYEDLPAFIADLTSLEPTAGRNALLFLIFTAARSGEVRGATWAEIDLNTKRWSIPGNRMKAGQPHSVPLSEQAIALLAPLHIGHAPDEPIFLGLPKAGSKRAMSNMTMAKALKAAGGEGFTVHGFRSTFRDWAAEKSGMPGEWAEAALAHTIPNKTEAAYRRTKFFDQRVGLMGLWSDFCQPQKPRFKAKAA